MHVLLDHLTAILVGATLLVALVFVQMRQQQTAVETTVRHRVQMQTTEFFSVLQRDVENTRTRAQTEHAFQGDYRLVLRRDTTADGEGYTSQFSFPTLKDPGLGGGSPVALVTYATTPTGRTVRVGESTRPEYRIVRHEYTRAGGSVETGGAVGVIDFDVILLCPGQTEVSDVGAGWNANVNCPGIAGVSRPSPVQARLSVTAAQDGPTALASDQRATSHSNAARLAEVVRLAGANARVGLPPVETGPEPGLPALPGDPPMPPPPPPSPAAPSPSPGSTTAAAPRPAGPSSPSAPPPPPPAPPPPPPGRSI